MNTQRPNKFIEAPLGTWPSRYGCLPCVPRARSLSFD